MAHILRYVHEVHSACAGPNPRYDENTFSRRKLIEAKLPKIPRDPIGAIGRGLLSLSLDPELLTCRHDLVSVAPGDNHFGARGCAVYLYIECGSVESPEVL
jgi:hypothetical protein